MTMQARQEQADEVRQWERDWRETITGQVRDIAKTTGDMAGVVREMQGDVRDLMEWKANQEKRRDSRDDQRPQLDRATLSIILSALTALIYALTFIAPHWH